MSLADTNTKILKKQPCKIIQILVNTADRNCPIQYFCIFAEVRNFKAKNVQHALDLPEKIGVLYDENVSFGDLFDLIITFLPPDLKCMC